MIFEICFEEASISPIADTASLTTSPESWASDFIVATTFAASPAPAAVCFTLAVNCSSAAAVCSRLRGLFLGAARQVVRGLGDLLRSGFYALRRARHRGDRVPQPSDSRIEIDLELLELGGEFGVDARRQIAGGEALKRSRRHFHGLGGPAFGLLSRRLCAAALFVEGFEIA